MFTSLGGVGKIVSLTRGEGGQIRDVSVGPRKTLAEVRANELSRSAEMLGVVDTVCHHYGDGTLANQDSGGLVELARDTIEDFKPDVVISFGPDGATGHPDHVTVGEVAVRAGRLCEFSPVVLQAVFPHRRKLLIQLIVEWIGSLDHRVMGGPEFAHGLMLFADGTSMLGYAADQLDVRFYPPGSYVIEQGEPSGELFLVLSGEVDVVHEEFDGAMEYMATLAAGSFVGEDGIASGQPRNAHVVAKSSVTCFVLSPGKASSVATRGTTPQVDDFGANESVDLPEHFIEVDVTAYARHKIRALACHRSQYAITAEMFPDSLVEGIFGVEYFRQIS